MTLDHNTLLTAHNQTAAIYLSTDFGPLGTVKVTDNLLAGGSYTLYGGGHRLRRFLRDRDRQPVLPTVLPDGGYYGPVAYMPSSYTWSGNLWDDTGRTVSP